MATILVKGVTAKIDVIVIRIARVFIDSDKVIQTPAKEDDCDFDFGVTYTSRKIRKTTTINVEVWDDDDSGFFSSPDDLIIRKIGNVDSFLNNGYIEGPTMHLCEEGNPNEFVPTLECGLKFQNAIETVLLWEDEYVSS